MYRKKEYSIGGRKDTTTTLTHYRKGLHTYWKKEKKVRSGQVDVIRMVLLVLALSLMRGVKLTGKLLLESSAGSDRHRMLNGDKSGWYDDPDDSWWPYPWWALPLLSWMESMQGVRPVTRPSMEVLHTTDVFSTDDEEAAAAADDDDDDRTWR